MLRKISEVLTPSRGLQPARFCGLAAGLNRRPVFSLLALFALLVALPACGTTRFDGSVLAGPIGRAMLVPETDTRLTQPGVAGVTIDLLQPTGRRGTGSIQVGTTVSTADGSFSISVPRKQLAGGEVTVHAHAPSIFATKNSVYWPRTGERVLVLVRNRRTGSGGS